MEDGLLSLQWKNHRSTFFHILSGQLEKSRFSDVTLACDGELFPAHKLVLSTCSDYFATMLDSTNCKAPIIVLKDVKKNHLHCLLRYMYLGEAEVRQDDLSGLIKVAESLCIKGLAIPDRPPDKASSPVRTTSKKVREDPLPVSPPPSRKRARRDSGSLNKGPSSKQVNSSSSDSQVQCVAREETCQVSSPIKTECLDISSPPRDEIDGLYTSVDQIKIEQEHEVVDEGDCNIPLVESGDDTVDVPSYAQDDAGFDIAGPSRIGDSDLSLPWQQEDSDGAFLHELFDSNDVSQQQMKLDEFLQPLYSDFDELQRLKCTLAELGVSSIEDLEYVDPEKDLKDKFPVIKYRKLKKLFEQKFKRIKVQSTISDSSLSLDYRMDQSMLGSTSETSPSLPEYESPQNNKYDNTIHIHSVDSWAREFKIPWEKCPPVLLKAFENKEQPQKKHLLQFNRVIGDEIYSEVKHPGKRALKTIAQKIVKKYPVSFNYSVPGYGIIETGETVLVNRLSDYMNNLNRPKPNSLRKTLYNQKGKRLSGATYIKDSYGCVNFMVDSYPRGENEDSLRQKTLRLKEEYTKQQYSNQELENVFRITYALQRIEINKIDSTLTDVISMFPHLKLPKYLLIHFELLMDFNLCKRFDHEIGHKSSDIFQYAKVDGPPAARDLANHLSSLSKTLNTNLPITYGAILLLPTIFQEKALLINKELKGSLQGILGVNSSLPYPHIVVNGHCPFEKERSCSVICEGQVLIANLDFKTAISVLFASYYVFNLKYPEELPATFEFIQRFFANINPVRGNKHKTKKTRVDVDGKVFKLISKLRLTK